jgi:cellulose biosynthesis protein BcsQ
MYWFADRVEILNPGGPYGIVTRENFGRPGVTDYRNPLVAESMKVLGYVQRFGAGIAIAAASWNGTATRPRVRAGGVVRPRDRQEPEMNVIAFFNNKGGVGKTSLVYHLAWMYADRGLNVIAADLDPQANLTSMFLDEDRLEELWPDGEHPQSVLGAVGPMLRGLGDVGVPHVERVADRLGLIVGDLGLSRFEAKLSSAWPLCLDRDESAFRTVSAFHRLLSAAATDRRADVVLIDVGPNLGAINRSAIVAANFVVVPLASDLFSLQGLKNLGPTLRDWRNEWADRLSRRPADHSLGLPSADMQPAGYVVLQHAVRLDRPVKAYRRWTERIPGLYRSEVLGEPVGVAPPVESDPHCLALLKHYRSLMPLAQDARKPMFHLRTADGALGSHLSAVQNCYTDFKHLALKVAAKCGIAVR